MTQLAQAIDTVTTYLAAMECRDLDAAQALVVPEGLELVFPGNRQFSELSAVVANSSGRYLRMGKRITGRDTWESDGRVRVMITGTLRSKAFALSTGSNWRADRSPDSTSGTTPVSQ